MRIPGVTYYSINRGGVLREVVCENCGTEFFYALSRESVGKGTSLLFLNNSGAEQQATKTGEEGLAAMLAEDIDPVPCPKCFRYQDSMVRHLRDCSYWWMNVLAILCVVGSIISGAILLSMVLYDSVSNSTKFGCGVVLVAAGLSAYGIWILRGYWARLYEPNCDNYLAFRQLCNQPTMLKEDVEKFGAETLLAPIQKAHAKSAQDDVKFEYWLRMPVGLGLAGIGTYFAIMIGGDSIDGYASSKWPTTRATVTHATVDSISEKNDVGFVTHYFPSISYVYAVQGKEFTGTRFCYEPVKSRNRDEIQAIVRPLLPPTETVIYYKALNPAISVIRPGISNGRKAVSVLLGGLIVGGIGYFLFEFYRFQRLQKIA